MGDPCKPRSFRTLLPKQISSNSWANCGKNHMPDSILIQGVTFGHTDIPPILFLGFLHFEGCVFDDTFLISGAGVRGGVQFKDCTLNGTLTLRRCQIASDLSIEGLASTDSANGVLAIDGCEIDGSLSICDSSFKRLLVPDVRVAGNIEVRSTTVIHDGSFARAAVSGGMRISQPKGTLSTVKFGELDLQSVRVTGNLSLRGIQVKGVLDLHDGEVGGSVHFKPYFENLRSSSRTCRARLGKLHAPGLRANHSLDLRASRFSARSSSSMLLYAPFTPERRQSMKAAPA